MFEVIVKKTFTAAHALQDGLGLCETHHNHLWLVEARLCTMKTDSTGSAVDFRKLDAALGEIAAGFENKCFNDFEPFDKISPSAENIAQYFFDKLKHLFANKKIVSVTAWEDEGHGATYSPPL